MNKTKYLALAFAALTLGACTSDDVVSTGGGKDDGNATGYLSFAINLPSMSGNTRAGWGDTGVFDDGEESEYAVRDARVYFINSEGTIIQTSTPVLSWTGTPSDANVTKVSAVVTLESPLTDPASVLVVLNPSSKLPAVTDNTTKYSEFNAAIATTAATDFCTINKTSKIAENIMMTNAPIVEDDTSEGASAGDKIVQTLVPITASDIKKTEEESVANPVTVYVERVLAKVTVSSTGMTGPEDATFSVLGWEIDNTNTTTYPVRNTDFYAEGEKDFLTDSKWALSNVNRFYGTATYPVRTYFAEDPNYSTDATFALDNDGSKATLTESQPGYCLENTFDLSRQIGTQATRVLLKASYAPKFGAGESSFSGALSGYTAGDKFFIMGSQPATLYSAQELAKIIEAEVVKDDLYDFTISQGKTPDVDETKLKAAAATNKLAITADLFKDGAVTGDSDAFSELTDALMIKVYDPSATYYEIPIKHFGDALTPWTTGSYGTNEKAYLGRYGVVRNNWYEINIKSVSGPGDPVPPTPDGGQIDKDTRYISFTINILSWAKRSQDVHL